MFEVLDTFGGNIALGCTILKNSAMPILLFNWETGEKQWLTTPDYLTYIAKFSPDGESLLVYGRYSETEAKHQSRMQLIEIK